VVPGEAPHATLTRRRLVVAALDGGGLAKGMIGTEPRSLVAA
jgi:hypothetical protein